MFTIISGSPYHSLLLYPKSNDQNDLIGDFALPLGDDNHRCQLGFAQVLKGGTLNRELSSEIIGKLGID